MGFMRIRKCISFLPAGFIIYFLLHYLIYQPELQQVTRTRFIESSSKGKRSSIVYQAKLKETTEEYPYDGVINRVQMVHSSSVQAENNAQNSNSKENTPNENADAVRFPNHAKENAELQNPPHEPYIHGQDINSQRLPNSIYSTGANEVDALSHPDLQQHLFARKEELLDIVNSKPSKQLGIDKVVEIEDFPVKIDKPSLPGTKNQLYISFPPEKRESEIIINSVDNAANSKQSANDVPTIVKGNKNSDIQMTAAQSGDEVNLPSNVQHAGNSQLFIGAPRELLSNEDVPSNMPSNLGNESEHPAGTENANEEISSRDFKAFLPNVDAQNVAAGTLNNEAPNNLVHSPSKEDIYKAASSERDKKQDSPSEQNSPTIPEAIPPQYLKKSSSQVNSEEVPPQLKESESRQSLPQDSQQPKNEQPQKTPIIKKIVPSLAINNLKGKVKVGQLFEPGFQNPQMEICPNNGRYLRVLMLVTTAPDHERQRNAVRQTWGHFSMRKDIAMGFMVGRTLKPEIQTLIDRENERYGDIMEAKFIDHYSNLTLKTMAMFEWAKTYCSEARFILKTDDDMFINVPLLLAFINTKQKEQRAIFGRLAKGWKPVRNKKSKYYIDVATYNRVRYPEFLTGPAYLLTNDVIDEIYQKALNTTFFVLEDVLVTGFVSESLQIKRVGDSHFRNEKIKLVDTCKLMQSISIHMVTYEEQFDIYKRTLDGKTKCKIR